MTNLASIPEDVASTTARSGTIGSWADECELAEAYEREQDRRRTHLVILQKGLTNVRAELVSAIHPYTERWEMDYPEFVESCKDLRRRLWRTSTKLKRLMLLSLSQRIENLGMKEETTCLSLTPLSYDQITLQLVRSAQVIISIIPDSFDITMGSVADRNSALEELLQEATNMRQWLMARNAAVEISFLHDGVEEFHRLTHDLTLTRRFVRKEKAAQSLLDENASKFIWSVSCLGLLPTSSSDNPHAGRTRALISAKKHYLPLQVWSDRTFFQTNRLNHIMSKVLEDCKDKSRGFDTPGVRRTDADNAYTQLTSHHVVSDTEEFISIYRALGGRITGEPLFSPAELAMRVSEQKSRFGLYDGK